jgi:catechol 2,3-dioxygenase
MMYAGYLKLITIMLTGNYTIPAQARIGHVHLKVANLERSLQFYRDLLGFEVTMIYGEQGAFISAGGYHHHIGLNTWKSKDAPPAPIYGVGLYHIAIVYPTRKDLAMIYDRLLKAQYPLAGASDHGVSEAIYLDDPDKNGVELYWDRPKEQWPYKQDGKLEMFTNTLDVVDLLNEIEASLKMSRRP